MDSLKKLMTVLFYNLNGDKKENNLFVITETLMGAAANTTSTKWNTR